MKTPYLDTEINLIEGYKENKVASFYQIRKLVEYREIKQLLLHGVSNWLACKDKLPEHGETVLTYTPLTEMASEQIRLMKYGTLKSGFPAGITHWQKINKPTCY